MTHSKILLWTAVAMLCTLPMRSAEAQVQDKDQQKCISALNKGGATVAKQQGKQNAKCVKNAGKGKEEDAQACVVTLSKNVAKGGDSTLSSSSGVTATSSRAARNMA